MIRELGIYSIKIDEDQWCVNLEIGLTKPKRQESEKNIIGKSEPLLRNKIYMNGNELDLGSGSKVELEFEVPQRTIDIIKEKSDILTKDLEECNETPAIIDNKVPNIVVKKNVKAGESLYPSDFKLDYTKSTTITKKNKRKRKRSNNKKVNKMSKGLV